MSDLNAGSLLLAVFTLAGTQAVVYHREVVKRRQDRFEEAYEILMQLDDMERDYPFLSSLDEMEMQLEKENALTRSLSFKTLMYFPDLHLSAHGMGTVMWQFKGRREAGENLSEVKAHYAEGRQIRSKTVNDLMNRMLACRSYFLWSGRHWWRCFRPF